MLPSGKTIILVAAIVLGSASCGRNDTPPPKEPHSPQQDITFVKGFYDEEGGPNLRWRWMQNEGIVGLSNTRQNMVLRVKGSAPEGLDRVPEVTIEFNGQVLDRFTGSMDFETEYEITAPLQRPAEQNVMVIRTDATVTPAELGLGSDARRLGLSINEISWTPRAER